MYQDHLEGLLQQRCWAPSQSVWFCRSELRPKNLISNKFLRETDVLSGNHTLKTISPGNNAFHIQWLKKLFNSMKHKYLGLVSSWIPSCKSEDERNIVVCIVYKMRSNLVSILGVGIICWWEMSKRNAPCSRIHSVLINQTSSKQIIIMQ